MNVRYQVELSQTERAELTGASERGPSVSGARIKMGRAYPEPASARVLRSKEL